MPLAIDRRLQTCSDDELARLMRRLSEAWERKGCPSFSEMSRVMLTEYQHLSDEFARRGVQLTLW